MDEQRQRSTDVSDTAASAAAAAAAVAFAIASLISRYRRSHPFVDVAAASCSNASQRRLNRSSTALRLT